MGWFFHDRRDRTESSRPLERRADFRRGRPRGAPVMAVAVGRPAERIVRAAVEALGGMGSFVSPGETVLLKPNAAWDRLPEQGADTNPDVVRAVALLCREAGAREVVVTDVPCNDAARSFHRSGIARAAREAGARLLVPRLRDFGEVRIRGRVLASWPMLLPLFRADRVINLPVAKHHSLAGLTLGMKNWYGLLGGLRNRLHQRIHDSIADLAELVRPTLTVLDATRILVRNGPQGGNLEDVEVRDTVVAGVDPVAVDAYAAELFGRRPDEIGYIVRAAERGLGRMDWRRLDPPVRRLEARS